MGQWQPVQYPTDIHIITHKSSETIAKNDSITKNESIVSKSNESQCTRNRSFCPVSMS